MKARSFGESEVPGCKSRKASTAEIGEMVFVAVLLIVTVSGSLRMLVGLVIALFS